MNDTGEIHVKRWRAVLSGGPDDGSTRPIREPLPLNLAAFAGRYVYLERDDTTLTATYRWLPHHPTPM